jgi:hypothetical protein
MNFMAECVNMLYMTQLSSALHYIRVVGGHMCFMFYNIHNLLEHGASSETVRGRQLQILLQNMKKFNTYF